MSRQSGRFRHLAIGLGVVDLVEGHVTYFGPNEGAFIVADKTAVNLISHAVIRCLRFNERGQAALIVPGSAKGAEKQSNTFVEKNGFTLE